MDDNLRTMTAAEHRDSLQLSRVTARLETFEEYVLRRLRAFITQEPTSEFQAGERHILRRMYSAHAMTGLSEDEYNALFGREDGTTWNRFNPFADIKEFHEKFGLNYDGKPRILDAEHAAFRNTTHREEVGEWWDAQILATGISVTQILEDQIDALVDAVYFLLGTAYLQGFNFEEAWRRVHAANMAKVRAAKESDSKRGSTFDVVKPPGWTPPSHRDLVEDHA